MAVLARTTHGARWDLEDAIRAGRPPAEVLALLDAYDEIRGHEAGTTLARPHEVGAAFAAGSAASRAAATTRTGGTA